MNYALTKTDFAEAIVIDEGNIVICQFKEYKKIELDIAERIIEKIGEIVAYTNYGLLVDAQKLFFITSEARKHFGQQKNSNIKAVALVVNSRLQKNFANLYLTFANPLMLTRVFNEEKEAREWLRMKCE
jgi:hypothetical protein